MDFTKKIRITALLLAVMVLAGCSAQPNTSFSGSKQDSATIPQTSAVSETSQTEDTSSQEATMESMEETVEQTASESTDKHKTTKEVESTASEPITSSQSVTDKPKTAKTETVTAEVERTEAPIIPSESTSQTEKQPATESVIEPVTETEATVQTESEPEQAAPFDIDYWISYAKTTAQQNGLSLDSTATDCWDNPISANPDCIYLERDISSRMSRYARDGFTCVWVWYECVGTDSYLIYVGYA